MTIFLMKYESFLSPLTPKQLLYASKSSLRDRKTNPNQSGGLV